MTVNLYMGAILAVAAILSILVFVRKVFLKVSQVLAIVCWIYVNAILFTYLPFTVNLITPMVNVPSVFYTIFVIHTMLPLSRQVSFALGLITGVADLIIVGIMSKLNGTINTSQVSMHHNQGKHYQGVQNELLTSYICNRMVRYTLSHNSFKVSA